MQSRRDKTVSHSHVDPKVILQADASTTLKVGQPVYLDTDGLYKPAIANSVQSSNIQGIVWEVFADKFLLRVNPGPMSYRFPLTKEFFLTNGAGRVLELSPNPTKIPGNQGNRLYLSTTVPGELTNIKPSCDSVLVGYKTEYGFMYRPKINADCVYPYESSSSSEFSSSSGSSQSSSGPASSSSSSSTTCFVSFYKECYYSLDINEEWQLTASKIVQLHDYAPAELMNVALLGTVDITGGEPRYAQCDGDNVTCNSVTVSGSNNEVLHGYGYEVDHDYAKRTVITPILIHAEARDIYACSSSSIAAVCTIDGNCPDPSIIPRYCHSSSSSSSSNSSSSSSDSSSSSSNSSSLSSSRSSISSASSSSSRSSRSSVSSSRSSRSSRSSSLSSRSSSLSSRSSSLSSRSSASSSKSSTSSGPGDFVCTTTYESFWDECASSWSAPTIAEEDPTVCAGNENNNIWIKAGVTPCYAYYYATEFTPCTGEPEECSTVSGPSSTPSGLPTVPCGCSSSRSSSRSSIGSGSSSRSSRSSSRSSRSSVSSSNSSTSSGDQVCVYIYTATYNTCQQQWNIDNTDPAGFCGTPGQDTGGWIYDILSPGCGLQHCCARRIIASATVCTSDGICFTGAPDPGDPSDDLSPDDCEAAFPCTSSSLSSNSSDTPSSSNSSDTPSSSRSSSSAGLVCATTYKSEWDECASSWGAAVQLGSATCGSGSDPNLNVWVKGETGFDGCNAYYLATENQPCFTPGDFCDDITPAPEDLPTGLPNGPCTCESSSSRSSSKSSSSKSSSSRSSSRSSSSRSSSSKSSSSSSVTPASSNSSSKSSSKSSSRSSSSKSSSSISSSKSSSSSSRSQSSSSRSSSLSSSSKSSSSRSSSKSSSSKSSSSRSSSLSSSSKSSSSRSSSRSSSLSSSSKSSSSRSSSLSSSSKSSSSRSSSKSSSSKSSSSRSSSSSSRSSSRSSSKSSSSAGCTGSLCVTQWESIYNCTSSAWSTPTAVNTYCGGSGDAMPWQDGPFGCYNSTVIVSATSCCQDGTCTPPSSPPPPGSPPSFGTCCSSSSGGSG